MMYKYSEKDSPYPISVKDILSNDKYYIPLYQRNFAWGKDEIDQLLTDITKSMGNYYLGTLVVSECGSDYEIIDGQQRHTTLSIINAVLLHNENVSISIPERNLYFKARTSTEDVFDKLLRDKSSYENVREEPTKDQGVINILNAVKWVEEFLFDYGGDDGYKKLQEFAERFYNSVFVFRVRLPERTDLNHYFEIMNSRGEQLEEHEILKASFMEKISGEKERKAFAEIWEACSNMNDHIQMCFENKEVGTYKGDRKEIFGENCLRMPDIDSFLKHQSEEKSGSYTISSLIENHELPSGFDQNKKEAIYEKFKSVIDFPNFLLIVLKLMNEKETVSLDSDFLLKNFGDKDNSLPDAMTFIKELLKYRTLFDRFVIKRKGEEAAWNWSLQIVSSDKDGYCYKSTFEDDNLFQKIRMIQSMLQVTFTSNRYKNWVFHLLNKVNENTEASKLLDLLEDWTKDYYKKDKQIKSQGLQTPIFLFNYLDYILWVEYFDKVSGKTVLDQNERGGYLEQINKVKSKFDNFKFVQRTSREHLFPQSRENDIEGENKNEILNSFGNLCLISRSSNSAYNSDLPIQKRSDYEKNKKNESLKQSIMFASFDDDEVKDEIKRWNTNQISKHNDEMIKLIDKYTNEEKS